MNYIKKLSILTEQLTHYNEIGKTIGKLTKSFDRQHVKLGTVALPRIYICIQIMWKGTCFHYRIIIGESMLFGQQLKREKR